MQDDPFFLSVSELSSRLRARKVSSADLTEAYLKRIESWNPKINAFITVTRETAIEQARQADREIATGHLRGPLHGIPYAAKDLFATKGIRTTWGSRVFADQVPDFDASVIEKLRAAGAVLLGKLSMSELAGGPPGGTVNGPVHNPWELSHWAHGSSTGPGACVAAGFSPIALGTETTASILNPASACGVVGFRPTYGRISRYGAMPLSWTMDKAGPLARRVADCATVFKILHGADARDRTSVTTPFRFAPGLRLNGRRIGVVRDEWKRVNEMKTGASYATALDVLRQLGARIEDVDLPAFPYREVSSFVWQIEGAAVFAPYERNGKLKEGLVSKAKWLGWKAAMLVPAADYVRVLQIRHAIGLKTRELFERFDVLLGAMNPSGARPIEPAMETRLKDRPAFRSDLLTLGNIAGLPGVSVPCGFTHEGLPLGLAFVGAPMADGRVLEVAHAFESATPWHARVPPMTLNASTADPPVF